MKTRGLYQYTVLRCPFFTLFTSLCSHSSLSTSLWPWSLSPSRNRGKQNFRKQRLIRIRFVITNHLLAIPIVLNKSSTFIFHFSTLKGELVLRTNLMKWKRLTMYYECKAWMYWQEVENNVKTSLRYFHANQFKDQIIVNHSDQI